VIAQLAMYDRPETAAAHDALWALVRDGLRARGIAAPDALDRATFFLDAYARPDLVLAQVCNRPWRARFRAGLVVIAHADYGLPDTPAGYYRSVMVARPGPLPAAPRLAVNDLLSNSGWEAPQVWALGAGLPLGPVVETGAHRLSLRAVAEGQADLAGIDAVTWRLLRRHEPDLAAAVEPIGVTPPSPGMAFVCAAPADPAPRRAALEGAVAALPPWAAEALGLDGLADIPEEARLRPWG
jgi:hypothetical protein